MNSDQLKILRDLVDKLIADHRKEAEKESKDKDTIKDELMTLLSDIDNDSLNDSATISVDNSAVTIQTKNLGCFIKSILKQCKKTDKAIKEVETKDESKVYDDLDTELLKIGFKKRDGIKGLYWGWVKDDIAIYSTRITWYILKDNREVCVLRDAKKWEVLQRVMEIIKDART